MYTIPNLHDEVPDPQTAHLGRSRSHTQPGAEAVAIDGRLMTAI